MKFRLGELIIFRDRPFVIRTGKFSNDHLSGNLRGNGIGVIVEIKHPMLDSRLYYTYRVHYQNGYNSWETEETLLSIEKYTKITGSYKKD
jgi:hypothetical protein